MLEAEGVRLRAQTLQTLYARMVYRAADIRWEHMFEEVLVETPVPGARGSAARQLTIDFHRCAPVTGDGVRACSAAPHSLLN